MGNFEGILPPLELIFCITQKMNDNNQTSNVIVKWKGGENFLLCRKSEILSVVKVHVHSSCGIMPSGGS